MRKISGLILTKNNSRTIRECVSSISPLVDELRIIDDFSSDDTLEIIKKIKPDAVIDRRKLERYDKQRNFGIEAAHNDWILMIDSDEIIESDLAHAIGDWKEKDEEENIDAYWVTRLNRFFNTYLKEEYRNRPLLFRRNLRFSYPVHEIILINEKKIKKLPGRLRHESWTSITKNMEKMNSYSSLIADKWIEQERSYGSLKLFFLALGLPIRYFFICFFGKKFYKAGLIRGFFYSVFESSWWLAVVFKYQEKTRLR